MTRQVSLNRLVQCAKELRLAYKPLKEAAEHMNMADFHLCPDFRIAYILDIRDALRTKLGVLDVEIGWIEGEIARRRKVG